MKSPQILFFDSENAPNIATTWGIYDQRISYNDILKEWFFISAQWAWNDSKKINHFSILDDAKRFNKNYADDYAVVKKAHEIISEADIIVGHNVKNHDLKKLHAKFIEYKLGPVKMPEIVDTLAWSRKFGFTSRKLGDLCSKLGLEKKSQHDPGIFQKSSLGDVDSIKKVVKYGIGDIAPLRELYKILLPYAQSHPNMNLYRSSGIKCCPRCSSDDFHASGFAVTRVGKFQKFHCMECGHYFKSGKSMQRVEMR